MTGPILYITGTGTGVGKTTLAALLLQRARARGLRIAALKPFCSGGREDAEKLQALQNSGLTLDQVNPFHFTEPLAPLAAARLLGERITLEETLAKLPHVNCPTLIEGAGGLLTPLGENFSFLDLIRRIPERVCVVGVNSLGILNYALLTARQLAAFQFCFVLMQPLEPDPSSKTNVEILRNLLPETAIFEMPRPENTLISEAAVDPLLDWWLR